jgi:hypothetical protein
MSCIRSQAAWFGLALMLAACTRTSRGASVGAARGSGTPGAAALPAPAGQPATATSSPNMSRKRVAAREEPATLIADDRSRCTVTAERFRDTKVGDNVICDWRAGEH